MTVIRTHDDEHDVSCDAEALDVLQAEVERGGASGADVAELAGAILDVRSGDYGTGISTSRPAVALLTTSSYTPAEIFAGYWQPDGSWRDVDGGPGGLELAQTIADHLSREDMLKPGAVQSVTVDSSHSSERLLSHRPGGAGASARGSISRSAEAGVDGATDFASGRASAVEQGLGVYLGSGDEARRGHQRLQ